MASPGAGSLGKRASMSTSPPANTWLRPSPSVHGIGAFQMPLSASWTVQPVTGSLPVTTTFSPLQGLTVMGFPGSPERGDVTVPR